MRTVLFYQLLTSKRCTVRCLVGTDLSLNPAFLANFPHFPPWSGIENYELKTQ